MNARMIMHPEDAKAIQVLKKVPGVDLIAEFIMEGGYEDYYRGENLGELVQVNETNFPEVYNSFLDVVNTVKIKTPELYIYNSPWMNAYTYGEYRTFVALSSSIIEAMTQEELRSIMAHECGHILCKHTYYKTVLAILEEFGEKIGFITRTTVAPIVIAIRAWDRRSELSADRCAAAVVGERIFQSATLKMASGMKEIKGDPYQLVNQAKEYEKLASRSWLDRISQGYRIAFKTHPQMCHRALEIDRWKNSWQYRSLRSSIVSQKCPSIG